MLLGLSVYPCFFFPRFLQSDSSWQDSSIGSTELDVNLEGHGTLQIAASVLLLVGMSTHGDQARTVRCLGKASSRILADAAVLSLLHDKECQSQWRMARPD